MKTNRNCASNCHEQQEQQYEEQSYISFSRWNTSKRSKTRKR